MDTELTPTALAAFVGQERTLLKAEEQIERQLDIATLVERGSAIAGLNIVRESGGNLVGRCDANESRLRIGDRVELRAESQHLTAVLTDLRDYGREVHLRPASAVQPSSPGPWAARLLPVDVSGLVQSCLGKLRPGAPGWSFFRVLSGVSSPPPPGELGPRAKSTAVADLLADVNPGVDESQREVLELCATLPSILAVQGPPGTGKTRVLALAAEACARLGKRTLVVAPTHQAVNNALSTIRQCFPQRRTVKVGDQLRRESLLEGVECALFEDGSPRSPIPATCESITGMTFLSALHHLVLRRSGLAPHVILIDEAGQLPLTQGASAGLIGAASIFLFGDDAQMPPVFPSSLDGDPIATSVFAQLRTTAPTSLRMLSTTYRLNAELCGLIGGVFYPSATGSDLRPSVDAGSRVFPTIPDGAVLLTEPVASALRSTASFIVIESPAGSHRQANPVEARCISELLGACIEGGLPPDAIAVVTPYRRQAALIRSFLQNRLPSNMLLPVIDTVERVQGLTVELIAISLCVSDRDHALAAAPFLLSPNRLNVAVSRARTKVVLVASSTLLDLSEDDLGTTAQWSTLVRRVAHRLSLRRA